MKAMVSVMRSIVHKEVPPIKGFVRGELESSGFVVKYTAQEPNISYVSYLVQVINKNI